MKHRLLGYMLFSLIAALGFGLIYASPARAAITIDDSANGNQCLLIGAWDNATKTCTLAMDLNGSDEPTSITIAGDNVTLDGNGHSLTGYKQIGAGITVSGIQSATIKNLTIKNYYYGIWLVGGGSQTNHGKIQGNIFSGNKIGVYAPSTTHYNDIVGNVFSDSGTAVILHDWSAQNSILYNRITYSTSPGVVTYGISLPDYAGYNTISGNTFETPTEYAIIPVKLASGTTTNFISANNFLNTGNWQNVDPVDDGTSNSFFFSYLGAGWGNHWDNYDSPAEGCNNYTFDSFCDQAHDVSGSSPATDDYPYILRGGWNRYDFTWYDNVNASNWILVANPSGSGDVWADLRVGSQDRDLPRLPRFGPGQVPAGRSVAASFPGLIGGPVEVDSRSFQKTVTSQRILWPAGGSSLEEVPGTSASRFSSILWWPWYDMQSPGFQDWVLISNPNSFNIYAGVFLDNNPQPLWEGVIPAGSESNLTFPGHIGGPLQVAALAEGTSQQAQIMASQRVLSNNGRAFNEVPGIPDSELSSHYVWTWYDEASHGAADWVLVANPSTSDWVTATISFTDQVSGQFQTFNHDLSPGERWTPDFPGMMGGPVHVSATKQGQPWTAANIIASQRVLWGPSFEEVPGMPFDKLSSTADWTWYDQSEGPGVQNWVLVANPTTDPVTATVSFTNQITGTLTSDSKNLAPWEEWTPQFDGQMGGPVHVSAVKQGTSEARDVIASQRVLWNGYFNEVWGQ